MVNIISVILGSDSDIEIYKDVASVLKDFDISFEKRIISAHRTPDELREYVGGAEQRGIKVFITIAGMAAALPGVVASFTTLPVIGVPVALKSPVMGFDSLFSMLQMPPGIPVATVAINGGKNAALLAVQILGNSNPSISEQLKSYREDLRKRVRKKNQKFQKEI
jgi:5-(carboxyamino)imidazole ribonucleotide mutase